MEKTEIVLTAKVPKGVSTKFKTRLYLENEIVDEHESSSYFP